MMRNVLVIVALLAHAQADEDDGGNYVKKWSNNIRKHYCGTDLRIQLMMICDSHYKRSSPSEDNQLGHDDLLGDVMEVDNTLAEFPFRSRAKALALLPEYFQRWTRGVADECCSKPCTIHELSLYCGKNPSRTSTLRGSNKVY